MAHGYWVRQLARTLRDYDKTLSKEQSLGLAAVALEDICANTSQKMDSAGRRLLRENGVSREHSFLAKQVWHAMNQAQLDIP